MGNTCTQPAHSVAAKLKQPSHSQAAAAAAGTPPASTSAADRPSRDGMWGMQHSALPFDCIVEITMHLDRYNNVVCVLQTCRLTMSLKDQILEQWVLKSPTPSKLPAAAELGLSSAVLQILSMPNARPTFKECCAAALRAARSGQVEALELLIQHDTSYGACLRARSVLERDQDACGNTALHWSAVRGQKRVVQALLELGVRVDQPNKWGFTALCVACYHCHNHDVISTLCNGTGGQKAVREGGGRPPNSTMSPYVVTPLHAACMAGNAAAVDVLLQHNAIVQALDPFRRTPVHWACMGGHAECIERLLQAPGVVDSLVTKDNTRMVFRVGFTPKGHAKKAPVARGRRAQVIQLLRDYKYQRQALKEREGMPIEMDRSEAGSEDVPPCLDFKKIRIDPHSDFILVFPIIGVCTTPCWIVWYLVLNSIKKDVDKERLVERGLVKCFHVP